LQVDVSAAKEREYALYQQQQQREEINRKLHTWVCKEVEYKLAHHLNEVLNLSTFNNSTCALLDLLCSASATYSKLADSVRQIPWLEETLLAKFNSGALTHGKKPHTIVTQAKTMFSLMGIENAQLIIPSILFQRAIPPLTEPFPATKERILAYSMSLAHALYLLYADQPRKQVPIYIFALHHTMGANMLIKLFFKAFEQVRTEQLQSSEKARMQAHFDVLRELPPDARACAKLLRRYGDKLSQSLCLALPYRYLPVHAIDTQVQACDADIMPRFAAATQFAEQTVAKRFVRKNIELNNADMWPLCAPKMREWGQQQSLWQPYALVK
jgi:hypothetical protein